MIRAVDSKSSVRTCFIIWSISIRATICMGDYMAYWHEVYTEFPFDLSMLLAPLLALHHGICIGFDSNKHGGGHMNVFSRLLSSFPVWER